MRGKESVRAATLLLPAAGLLLVALAFNGLRGPFFYAVDPDYIYLLNALRVAEGRVPTHNDHPGTPVQVLGATLLHARHLATGRPYGSLREHVLREPEAFLRCWRATTLGLILLALGGGALVVRRATESFAAALAFGLLPLLSSAFVLALGRVEAEPTYLAAGLGLVALTIAAAADPGRWQHGRVVALMGVLAGLGLATKVVFLPVACAPLFALHRGARRRYALVGTIVFAVALAPIATRLPHVARWLWTVASHTGYYGEGGTGLVDVARLPWAIGLAVRAEWLTLSLLAASAAAALLLRGAPDPSARRRGRVLAAVAGLQAAWTLIAIRHYMGPRYLLPAVLLNGLVSALLIAAGDPRTRPVRAAVVALLAGAAALAPWTLRVDARRLEQEKAGRDEAAAAMARLGPPLVDDSFGLSPAGALNFANGMAGEVYASDLRRTHPDYISWWSEGLRAFGEQLPLSAGLRPDRAGAPVVMAMVQDGSGVVLRPPFPLVLERPVRYHGHVLYTARPDPCTTGDDAFTGFWDAEGLRWPEGPYPQWAMPRPVRWGLRPHTRLRYASGREMTLSVAVRHFAAEPQRLRVWLDGTVIARWKVRPGPAFQEFAVTFAPRPTVDQLELRYGPGEPGGLALLFERIRLTCGGAPDARARPAG